MSENVRWEEFDQFHVIRRLRELIGKIWNIQINFTDHKGLLRGVPEGRFFNPLNPVCKAVVADTKGFSACRGSARQMTVDVTHSQHSKVSRCHAGFTTISVPIRIDGNYMGCVFADGFLLTDTAVDQREQIKTYLQRAFPGQEKELSVHVDSLPVLTPADIKYLTELINLVVDEILVTHKSLSVEKEKVNELSRELGTRYQFSNMIGKSSTMQKLYNLVERVSDSDSTVLVHGENGTGKELIARALHYNSRRRKRKFVVVNCGAFNENLLESELFGHVRGAFTGAVRDKRGLFEEADGGTLFLDEIGETSMPMQVKMLRVLQEGTFTPVGATSERRSDVRILAATNRNLSEMVKDGSFREDLFYRLNVISVTVPALRERREDIKLLAEHFLKVNAKSSGKGEKILAQECFELMMNHDWPGNVRELENEIERLCVLAGNDVELSADLLSPRVREHAINSVAAQRLSGKLKDALEELEKQMILEGLRRTRWNKSKLAKELGISRAGLINKVEKYGLEKRTV